jgi:hypothetical protein
MANEFAKVNAAICRIKERAFASITLKLDITDLHIQIQRAGYGAGVNEDIALFFAHLVQTFQVPIVCLAYHLTQAGVLAYLLSFHLQTHQFTGQGYGAYVKTTANGLYYHPIAGGSTGMLRVFEKIFA